MSQCKSLDVLEVAAAGDAPVVNEQPRSQAVGRKERDQVLQGAGVMDVAVKDLVKQGKAFLLRHAQTDLDQGAALDLLLVVAGFAQRTMSAIEVGVGHIVDDAGGPEPVVAANPFEEPPLPGLRVEASKLFKAPTRRLSVKPSRSRRKFRSVRSNQLGM